MEPAASDSALGHAQQEIDALRAEVDRLRKERDTYSEEALQLSRRFDDIVNAKLQLFSVQLAKEVKNDLLGAAKHAFWIVPLLLTVATLGGYWRLSDLVAERVDSQIDTKQKELQKLRDQVLDSLIEVRSSANKTVNDVKAEAEKAMVELERAKRNVQTESQAAITEIRSRQLTLVAQTGSSATEVQVKQTSVKVGSWFGEVPSNLLAIAGSQFGQSGSDAVIEGANRGTFSYYLSLALSAEKSASKGGEITFRDAVSWATKRIKQEKYDQTPTLVESGTPLALFTSRPIDQAKRPYSTLRALLVGINRYQVPGADLRSPVNDVQAFSKLLQQTQRLLVREVETVILTDFAATKSNILEKIGHLVAQSSSDDVLLFYFSGHISDIPDPNTGSRLAILAPTDLDWRDPLMVTDVVRMVSKAQAKKGVIIIDG